MIGTDLFFVLSSNERLGIVRSDQVNGANDAVAGVLVAPVAAEPGAQANGVEDDEQAKDDGADGDAGVEGRVVAVLLDLSEIYNDRRVRS